MQRLVCETFEIEAAAKCHVAVGLCQRDGQPIEVVLNRVDRSRDDMTDEILSNLAIAISRLLQGRDPTTGDPSA